MKQQTDMLIKAGIVTITIFQSSTDNLLKYSDATVSNNDATVLLSDERGVAYNSFMVNKQETRRAIISYNKEMSKNQDVYKKFMVTKTIPAQLSFIKDHRKQLFTQPARTPAIYLINEEGVICDLFRAETLTDSMPFDRIEAFIPEERRCRCNKKDCLTSNCRKNYEEIRKETELAYSYHHDG